MKQDSLYQQVYTDLKSAIDSMADGLGVAAEHVYEVMVMQQFINSLAYSVLILTGVVLIVISIKAMQSVEDWDEAPSVMGICGILLGILGLVVFSTGIININDIITGFLNPEYGAIKEIMSFVK